MKLKPLISEAAATSGLFNVDTDSIDQVKKEIRQTLGKVVPYVHVDHSSLGGENNTSLYVTISLNPSKDWNHGILQNSNYSKFSISRTGVIEQFAKDYKIKTKFRKSRAKTLDQAISKIVKYIKSIQ